MQSFLFPKSALVQLDEINDEILYFLRSALLFSSLENIIISIPKKNENYILYMLIASYNFWGFRLLTRGLPALLLFVVD